VGLGAVDVRSDGTAAEARIDRVEIRPAPSRPDQIFRGIARTAAVAVLVLMGLIGFFLLHRSASALRTAGWRFLSEFNWLPAAGTFGIAGVLTGTILIALIALIIAVPIALGTALFIAEYTVGKAQRVLISLIDLMAAVPSIVYGLWGFFFLQPRIIDLSRWLSEHASFLPFFQVETPKFAASTFIAGVVVSLMIIPITCSVMREVFSQAPVGEREGAIALGSTRWGVIRSVVLPFGRGGMIGGIMLGLGRAMGETIAVYLIISMLFAPPSRLIHVLETGGASISSLIALRYGDSDQSGLSALLAAGLALFLLTLIVNSAASVIVQRSRSGAATEI
jgi:phosphate transport system permease protein